MDTLKRTITQIQEQLALLNTSQKVAIALCAVIVAGSLMWLVGYAAQPDMVAVLAQDMTDEQIADSIRSLNAEGITAKQSGRRVLVQPVHRSRAIMLLGQNNVLPEDTSVGFAELMTESDPFRPADENEFRRRVAMGNELAMIIATSPDIQSARVMIQDVSKRRIGVGASIKPSSSVYVTMARGREMDQQAVEALCRFVAGAVPGLAPTDVVVVDAVTMQPRRIPTADEAASMGQLTERKRNEQHLAGKLLAALQSIPGILVTVSVELDTSKTTTTRQVWEQPAIKSEESNTTSSTSGGAGAESGVSPNVGLALNNSQPGSVSETEESRSEFHEPKSKEMTQIEKPPYRPIRSTASIGIPRSFLVGIYRARYGEDFDPATLDDEQRFADLRTTELNRVRGSAMKILMTSNPEDVEVDVFFDLAGDGKSLRDVATMTAEVAASSADSGMEYVRRYGVQSGLVVLALVSFLMMGRMVRRSAYTVDRLTGAKKKMPVGPEEILRVGGGPVGQAEEPDGMLVGREIDDATIRHQQLIEQISKMVGEHPKQAAEMIRHWAESSEN